MNWKKTLLSISLLSVLIACSDNDEPSGSTQAANTNTPAPSTETLKSDAKEKRSDAAAKRILGKVQTMTEEIYPGERAQKYSTKNVFKYDKNGNQLELSNYKPDGSLVSTIRSAYDSAGKLVAQETAVANGTIEIKSVIKTDANGNKVEQTDIKQDPRANKSFNYRYLYKYDEKAHEIERVAHLLNGSFIFKYTFAYDANGNRTEWLRLTQTNVILEKTGYKYDDKNNLIEEINYKPDGTVKETFTYTYVFDKKGNWTQQKKMQNGNVVEVKKREYKYF